MDIDSSQAVPDGRVGQRFGDYLVEGQIGQGGMGIVYRAHHESSGEVVALKLMAPDLAHNETFRERFIREAEAGPNLGHPNIVPVFESGEAGGELFIAMQLIEGIDLKGLIRQEGRLDPKRVLSIFRQAASALDAAHESGMVHRDVKPQNILVIPRESLEGTDRVYLTDFGLVRPVASETTASRTGTVFGSVPYMAPELIEGLPADGRADVYALGCVLYECLTGSVPFERDNEVSAVWAHIHEDPPLLTDKVPELPGGLNDVVIKALSKHPDDRFLTCGEFITELELGMGRKLSNLKYAYVRPLVARIPRGKTEREVWAPNYFPELARVRSATRERLDWRKVVAFATAIALLSSVQIGREGGLPRAVADVAGAAGDIGGTVIDSAFGQEGSQEAGSDGDASDEREPGVEPVFGTSDESGLPALPRASDAKAGGPAAGGDEGTPEVGNGALLEPLIAYYCAHEICVMTPDGTGRRSLTNSPTWEREPDWSPDGTKIVYTSLTDPVMVAGQEPIDLFVMDADGSGTARLTTDTRREGNPSWSPDGTTIAFDSREPESTDNLAIDYWITLVRADGTGGRQRVIRGTDPDWSPDGRWIVYNDPNEPSVIRIVRPDGSKDQAITPVRAASAYGPEWSPDGRFIAFFAEVPDKPGFLSVLDLLTGRIDKVQVKKLGDCCPSLSWTPDGQHMLFTLEAGFYVIKPDGTGQRLLVRDPGGSGPTWRPNSQA